MTTNDIKEDPVKISFSDSINQLISNLTPLYLYPFVTKYVIPVNLSETSTTWGGQFRSLNPSIISFNNNYLVNVRAVNYELIDGWMRILDADNTIRTNNYMLHLVDKDDSFTVTSQTRLYINSSYPYKTHPKYTGMEDLQLFGREGNYQCMFTMWNNKPYCHMCKSRLNINVSDKGVLDVIATDLLLYDTGRIEKNWLPFIDDDNKTKALYHYDPFALIDLDKSLLTCMYKSIRGEEVITKGSAGPIDFDAGDVNGRLVMVHETPKLDNKRVYLHRLILYTKQWKIASMSDPFVFESLSIEFCRSMCMSNDNKFLLIGVGLYDKEAVIYKVPINIIKEMLVKI